MKRESGFNPRMSDDRQSKNIFKMTDKELDFENKNLENELEKLKKKGFKIPIVRSRNIVTSSSPKPQTKTENKIITNSNGKIKIKINPEFKTSTIYNTNHLEKNDSIFEDKTNTYNLNIKNSPQLNRSNNSNSFLSFSNNENSTSKSKEVVKDKHSINRANSNFKPTSFKHNLHRNTSDNLKETPDFEIKTYKTNKNLVPANHPVSNSIFHENQTEPYSSSNCSNHGQSHHTHSQIHVKNLVDKLKLCQKVNLPNEKNYFITEKNLKLIKESLSEKEADIDSLKSLLTLTKDDIENFQKRYDDLGGIIKELSDEKTIILANLENLFAENKQLKENYDDFSFQYNKILIYVKTIDKFIPLAFKWFDSFCDLLKCDDDSAGSLNSSKKISIPSDSRFNEVFRQIEKFLEEENFRSFNFLFSQAILKRAPQTFANIHYSSKNFYDTLIESTFSSTQNFLFSDVDVDYFKMERMNSQLKKKINDYECFIKRLTHVYETKNVDLTEVAKDMIETKNRLAQLNTLNENLEKENEYLRISYHNLFNEMNKDKEEKVSKSQSNKIEEELNNVKSDYEKVQKENLEMQDLLDIINQTNSNLNSKAETLSIELNKLREQCDSEKLEAKKIMSNAISNEKHNEKINHLSVKISNLHEAIREKDEIIEQLKMRAIDLERINSLSKNQNKTRKLNKEDDINYDSEADTNYNNISEKNMNRKIEDKSWKEYLNQSDSNLIFRSAKKENEESCLMCKDLNRKILRYQLELECLKNIKNSKENVDIVNFMKLSKNASENNGKNSDLLLHCYNQAKLIDEIQISDE